MTRRISILVFFCILPGKTMDYQKLGLEILARVGGKGNVSKLTHCATRLRMEFNDDAKVDSKAIEALPGVISVVVRGGQFQIVVGNNVQQTFRVLQRRLASRKPALKSSSRKVAWCHGLSV